MMTSIELLVKSLMAEKTSVYLTNGGLWNTHKPQYSAETAKVLKNLMNESRINNFQRRQLTSHMLRGESLPESLGPSSSQSNAVSTKKRVESKRISRTAQASGIRSYQDIVHSGAYSPAEYRPRPIKPRTDQEKERLANLMAYGTDPTKMKKQNLERTPTPPREIDRFDELMMEVEERKQFLDQMAALGKRKEYQQLISNEIAEKIREMELIDRQRSKVLEQHLKVQSK